MEEGQSRTRTEAIPLAVAALALIAFVVWMFMGRETRFVPNASLREELPLEKILENLSVPQGSEGPIDPAVIESLSASP